MSKFWLGNITSVGESHMLDSAKARTPGTRATKDKVIRIMKRDAKGQGDHYYGLYEFLEEEYDD